MKKTSFRFGVTALLVSVSLLFQYANVTALGGVIDLSLNEQNVIIKGEFTNSTLGEVTALGDFNNDGYDDLLIGAAAASYSGRGNSGAAYMIPGRANPSSTYDLAATPARLEIYGASEGDIFGHSLAVGDVNGDGIDDMVIGADRVNAGGTIRGAVYVFFGSSSYYASNRVVDLSSQPAHLTIRGTVDNARLGRAVAVGDVNNDGRDDIIIGAYTLSPEGRTEAGGVYVVSGSNSWNTGSSVSIDLTTANALVTILGAQDPALFAIQVTIDEVEKTTNPVFADEVNSTLAGIGHRLGRSVASGKVNGDQYDDIIVGAYGADVNGRADAGKTYILYGRSFTTGTVINLQTAPGDINVTINGVDAGDQSGFYVATGNINGDTFDDVAIGAYRADAEAGEVYVVMGSSSLTGLRNLPGDAAVTVKGAAAGDRLGRSIAVADINGNVFADLLIGASRATPDGRTNAGKAYVIYDPGAGVYNLSQASSYHKVIYGAATGSPDCVVNDELGTITGNCPDELGRAISAGDFNGDGVNDIVVGALFANNGSKLNAGAAYVIYSPSKFIYLPLIRR